MRAPPAAVLMAVHDLQPVVFVGPSCPSDAVRAVIPHALIAPSVKRGDLYRYRMLGFPIFLIIDGVFSNTLAVSPREVIDVIEDGAAVVGASSMGALRAADCGPAGAIGHGRVFRLFRRGSLSSEDEVAVTFNPPRPWPPATQALVNVRFALHRAWRAGTLSAADAAALVSAAEGLPYQLRGWTSITKRARVRLSPAQHAALASCDVKREDAISCCRWLASRLGAGAIRAGPRRDPAGALGRMSQRRERTCDPFDGDNPRPVMPQLIEWLMVSGRSPPIDAEHLDPWAQSSETRALLMQFTAFRRAVVLADERHCAATAEDLARAGAEIARAHGAQDWNSLVAARHDLSAQLPAYRDRVARIGALSRDAFFGGATLPPWKRTGRGDGPFDG